MEKQQVLAGIDAVIESGPYKDTWASLVGHPVPQWYREAKLGFFIHWGLYSVPAYFTEWYPRLMYYRQNPVYWHHRRKYGKNFNYHDFIPRFTAENFDPAQWLGLFAACGADFVMPVAEHHDGFKMYASGLSPWNAAEMGPRRDVLGEIKAACEGRDIRFAASSHRAEHYWFMNGGKTIGYANATQDEALREFYGPCVDVQDKNNIFTLLKSGDNIPPSQDWLEDWLVHACEVIDKYQPSTFYFDFYTAKEEFRPYMRKFLAYYYNRAEQWGREVVSFYKEDAALYPCGVYVRERGLMDSIGRNVWQCETSTAYNAWSYCTTNKFKKAEDIACNMADVWSKNGCMALNIGPMGDGSICAEETEILTRLAAWIEKNREAIWGTAPYRTFGEGKKRRAASFKEKYSYTKEDFRFTYKLGCLYAFALAPRGQRRFRLRSMSRYNCNSVVRAVSVLGEDCKVSFRQVKRGLGGWLELELEKPVRGAMPICFKLEIE